MAVSCPTGVPYRARVPDVTGAPSTRRWFVAACCAGKPRPAQAVGLAECFRVRRQPEDWSTWPDPSQGRQGPDRADPLDGVGDRRQRLVDGAQSVCHAELRLQAANLVSGVCHNARDLLTDRSWAGQSNRPGLVECVGGAKHPARSPPALLPWIQQLVVLRVVGPIQQHRRARDDGETPQRRRATGAARGSRGQGVITDSFQRV
jgi:hypothetical protein